MFEQMQMFVHFRLEHLHFSFKIDREISKRDISINKTNQTLITLLKHTDIRSDDRMSECKKNKQTKIITKTIK